MAALKVLTELRMTAGRVEASHEVLSVLHGLEAAPVPEGKTEPHKLKSLARRRRLLNEFAVDKLHLKPKNKEAVTSTEASVFSMACRADS